MITLPIIFFSMILNYLLFCARTYIEEYFINKTKNKIVCANNGNKLKNMR